MGSEQSREGSIGETVQSNGEGKTKGSEAKAFDASNEAGRGCEPSPSLSSSPRPSISSDADLPYISYTVNRPIGDSPKRLAKGVIALKNSGGGPPRRLQRRLQQRPQEVVVVKEANSNSSLDPELARLQSIPTFLPIMRGALTAPNARDPEVLERLNAKAVISLCRRYQAHVYAAALMTSNKQDQLSAKIKAIGALSNSLVSDVTERQRAYARYAEKLSQVTEISHALTRCHASLNLILESMDALNEFLPIQERLEPFVWTTG